MIAYEYQVVTALGIPTNARIVPQWGIVDKNLQDDILDKLDEQYPEDSPHCLRRRSRKIVHTPWEKV